MGNWIELTAADGAKIAGYRADPPGKLRGGLVVVQEIFGVNSHIRDVCDGFAADGYLAVAPALFDRVERNVDLGYKDADMARGREIRGRVHTDHALADIAAARAVAASAGRVGVIGYCWGGLLAWLSASRLPGFSCAIAYYGGGMPDAIGEKPKVPVLAHFGEKDAHIPVEGVKKLAEAHPSMEVHFYPAGHGFNCDQRGSFDAPSATLARQRTIAFLHEHVG
jgi:carboxymethylenebutenolidase